jgi:lipoprotein NlpI
MDPWIAKAEHALRTGQPNMAELYMRRGLSESAVGRAWLARYDFGQALTAAGRELTRIYRETFGPVLDAFGMTR